MRITLIAAVARNGAIGRDNKLLYWLPEDLKRFILRFLPDELCKKFNVETFGWLDMLLKESDVNPGVLTRAFEEYNYEVGVLKDAYEKAVEEKKQEYRDEIEAYLKYSTELDEILSSFDIKEGMLS